MRQLSLEPLSLPQLSGLDLVKAAAGAGFDLVSFVLETPDAQNLPVDPMRHDATLRSQVRDAMRAAGLGMSTLECFNLAPDPNFASFAEALAAGGELGARNATAIIWENSDRQDALRSFCRLCDMAAEHGMDVNMEFISVSRSMGTMEDGLAFVRDAGRANAGLMMDLLHVVRGGTRIEAVRDVPPELVTGIQLSDGPLSISEAQLLHEAGGNRVDLGTGEFPIQAFVRALPPTVALGIEIPRADSVGRTDPFARAVELHDMAVAMLAEIS